jgi:HK97 family phage major capsid protein
MTRTRFSVMPLLLSMVVAIASMPTEIYQICAWNVGTVKTEPWRSKRLTQHIAARIADFKDRIGQWFRFAGGWSAVATAALFLVAMSSADAQSLSMAIAAPIGLKALREKSAELHTKLKALNDKAIAAATASGPALTDEERASVATLKAEFENVESLRGEAERLNEQERKFGQVADDPDAKAAADATRRAGIQMGKDNSQDDPKRGFKSHAEQMTAIIKAGKTGVVDPRLKPLAAAGSDEQSGHTDPHGGFMLAPAFAPGLLSVPAEVDPTAGRVTPVPMEASHVVINARVDKNHTTSVSGGLTVARVPATKAVTPSRMEFEKIELIAHDLTGTAFAANRILKESPSSFIALMQAGFGDEFAAKKLDERLNGSGAGEFQGVINDTATITVSKEVGQAADSILFENVNKMMARCWRYGQSIWLVNHDALPQVTTLYMPIGTGGERVAIYAPGKEDAPFGTLLGRPIFPTEFCRKVGDLGDIVLGNWSQYLEGQYGQMEESRSIHVRFLEREEAFLFVEMNDAKPWWRSALTPRYSTVTLAPFVVLEAR